MLQSEGEQERERERERFHLINQLVRARQKDHKSRDNFQTYICTQIKRKGRRTVAQACRSCVMYLRRQGIIITSDLKIDTSSA
jgi:hypothetical protein